MIANYIDIVHFTGLDWTVSNLNVTLRMDATDYQEAHLLLYTAIPPGAKAKRSAARFCWIEP
jgi:hypothetical protein